MQRVIPSDRDQLPTEILKRLSIRHVTDYSIPDQQFHQKGFAAALVGSSGPVLGSSVLAGDEPVPLPPLSVPVPSVPPVSPGQAAQAHITANKPRTPAT